MFTKKINFKTFIIKKINKEISKDLNLILKEKNKVIESLSTFYKYSYNKKIISTIKKYKDVRVIGMGGSILGTEAIYDFLREKIKKDGVRNSLTTACMPTASTGIILGNTETFQIQTSNIYKRQTLSGEFLLVNRHLVKALSQRNLWNKEMRDKIILENGSVQNISNFPEDLKETYKTVWETSQKSVIDMAADRAPFIDQTQSMNLWLSTPTFGKVNSMHMYAWKKGLKTGMYYLRSRSAVDAVKVTVSSEKVAKEDFIKSQVTESNEPEDCLTCSA